MAAVDNKRPERIVLIGYRGCGKTSVGSELAKLLSWRFLDVDEEIEREQGVAIDQIVAHVGWGGFREIERAIIKKICQMRRCVIAPGGGAVLNPRNVDILRRESKVFWLRADAQALLARMNGDPMSPSRRPPLTGLDPEQEVQRLLHEREPHYKNASDAVIDTQERSIHEVVQEILSALGL